MGPPSGEVVHKKTGQRIANNLQGPKKQCGEKGRPVPKKKNVSGKQSKGSLGPVSKKKMSGEGIIKAGALNRPRRVQRGYTQEREGVRSGQGGMAAKKHTKHKSARKTGAKKRKPGRPPEKLFIMVKMVGDLKL